MSGHTTQATRFVVRFYKADGTRVMAGKLQSNTYLRADCAGMVRAEALAAEHGEVIKHKVLEVGPR